MWFIKKMEWKMCKKQHLQQNSVLNHRTEVKKGGRGKLEG